MSDDYVDDPRLKELAKKYGSHGEFFVPDSYVDSGCTQPIPVVELCEKCGRMWEVGMWPTCKGNPADHGFSLRQSIFPAFEHEGQRISDLQQLRRIERESMEKYRGGERVSPIVWRDFSQNRSNGDSNVFGRPNVPGKPVRSNIKLKRRAGE